jgi:hypothetical protein
VPHQREISEHRVLRGKQKRDEKKISLVVQKE